VVASSVVKSALHPTHSPHPLHLSHPPLARAPPSFPRPSPTRHLHLQNRRNGNPLPAFNNTSTFSVLIVRACLLDGVIVSRAPPEILQDVGSGSGVGFRIGVGYLPFLRLFRIFPLRFLVLLPSLLRWRSPGQCLAGAGDAGNSNAIHR
jgi:hypothetical protein